MSTATQPRSMANLGPPVPRGDRATAELGARLLAALGVSGVALIHIVNAPDAYASTRYIFWLYMALVASSVPLITLLLHSRSPLIWAATVGFAAAPFVSFLLSRSVGLPGDSSEIGDWVNPLGIASLFVEASLIFLSLTRLWLLTQPGDRGGGRRAGHSGALVWPPLTSRAADGRRHSGAA